MSWEIRKIEFIHEYLGGHLYFDNYGKILSLAEKELAYSVGSVETKNVNVEKPSELITVNFSSSYFSIAQEEPPDNGESIFKQFLLWQPVIMNYINPASIEKTSIKISKVKRYRSEDELFKALAEISNSTFDLLSDKIMMPKLLQDIGFKFKSGSTMLSCDIGGQSFAPSNRKNVVVPFYSTPRIIEQTIKRNSKPHIKAGNDYTFAMSMGLTITDMSPITPSFDNSWNESGLFKLNEILSTSYRTIQGELKL